MKKTLTTIAAAALLGSATFAPLAMAQGTTQPAPATPGTAEPATPMTPGAPATSAAPSTSSTTGGSYLTEQGANQISANDYIGKAVYTAADESIGSVTNLILEENGGIVAAVVGVGGFLGIGAKDVAVPMDKITVTRDTQSGDVRLTTTETAESLKSAPEFMTMKDRKDAAGNATPAAPATDGGAAGTTTTAPKP